jgi:hypothetical protein
MVNRLSGSPKGDVVFRIRPRKAELEGFFVKNGKK